MLLQPVIWKPLHEKFEKKYTDETEKNIEL